jgi:hypothetical protein
MKYMLECDSIRGPVKLAIKGVNEEEVKEYCFRAYTGVYRINRVTEYDEYMKLYNPKTRQSSMQSFTHNNMNYRKRGKIKALVR